MRYAWIVLGACLASFGGLPACAPSSPESPPILLGSWTWSRTADPQGTSQGDVTLYADGTFRGEYGTSQVREGPDPSGRTPFTGIWSQQGNILTTTGQTRGGRPIPDSDPARVVRLVYRDGRLWPLPSGSGPSDFLRRK